MIITKMQGGLGNQMFQYAMAKAIAKKNKDKFKIDLSFYTNQKLRQYELHYFSIDENIADQSECSILKGENGFIRKLMIRLGVKLNVPASYICESKDDETKFQSSIYNLTGSLYLEGYWQNEKYFKNIRNEILQDFEAKDKLSDNAIQHLEAIRATHSVSLHIRRGDYLSNSKANKVHGICDLDYYKKAMTHISRCVKNPVVYIFSDDIEWCKKSLDFIENKVFVDNTKTVVDDLELMRNCNHNIIANSTFSWWGAWLNNNSNKIIIVPKKWFRSENMQHLTLAPKEWIAI